MNWRTAVKPALILFLCSWFSILAGIQLSKTEWIPKGEGNDLHSGIQRSLFRFDAEYYHRIATSGYAYDGDPHSSPNIVFAPLFPLLVDGLAYTGLDEVDAGFLLNRVFLFCAAMILYLFLQGLVDVKSPFWILFAMLTAAGAYSFHAFYSESTMLFLLSAALLAHQRRRWPIVAAAAALLGAARVTALPIVLLFSAHFLYLAWESRKDKTLAARFVVYALVCPAGLAAYLGYIGLHYGNPLRLFPEIQSASWGFFHPPTDWVGLLTGWKLAEHAGAAVGRGWSTFTDPKTLNLIWTVLALASTVYVLRRFRNEIFAWVFTVYFLFIYFTNSTSEYLISAHRFFALMLPIFLMFYGLHQWLDKKNRWLARVVTGLFLFLNLAYGLLHTAYFNNGVWYYF